MFLLLSEEAPNLRVAFSPGHPRGESLTNTLLDNPFLFKWWFYSPSAHDRRSSGSSPNSQMPSKHFSNPLQTYIALFVSVNDFQFHEYHITIPNFQSSGLMEANILHLSVMEFYLLDRRARVSSSIAFSGSIRKACDRTKSLSTLMRTILTLRYQS